MIECLYGAMIEVIGAFGSLADANHPELAKFTQCPDQMEGNALAAGGVEVEAVHHRNVHQIVGREAAIALRFEVVGRVVTARVPCLRKKLAGVDIITAVGQELEHEERMGGPALAKIDLDRVMAPRIALLHGNKIDAEAA